MACSCRGRQSSMKYEWTSSDGATTLVYNTEIEAKAKVLRKGGSYRPLSS